MLEKRFDALIVATGCTPPVLKNNEDDRVTRAWDVLAGRAKLGGSRVVVNGKGRGACETSEFLARRQKKEVTLIHSGLLEELGSELEPIFERRLLLGRLQEYGVKILCQTESPGSTPTGWRLKGRRPEAFLATILCWMNLRCPTVHSSTNFEERRTSSESAIVWTRATFTRPFMMVSGQAYSIE